MTFVADVGSRMASEADVGSMEHYIPTWGMQGPPNYGTHPKITQTTRHITTLGFPQAKITHDNPRLTLLKERCPIIGLTKGPTDQGLLLELHN